jgi:hypothetical protein
MEQTEGEKVREGMQREGEDGKGTGTTRGATGRDRDNMEKGRNAREGAGEGKQGKGREGRQGKSQKRRKGLERGARDGRLLPRDLRSSDINDHDGDDERSTDRPSDRSTVRLTDPSSDHARPTDRPTTATGKGEVGGMGLAPLYNH